MEDKDININGKTTEGNSKVVTMAMNIVRKNEALASLVKKIDKMRANPKFKDCLTELFDLQNSVRQTLQQDKDREILQLVIREKSELFFIRLRKKYPKLTLSEERLAALIRLGLSSKEIASVLNISVKSVEMNRYRLRKKLGIGAKTNLTKFIGEL